MTNYVKTSIVKNLPRIPLEGSLDLTYRCNNNCRHCWLRIPANSPEKENELTFDEIREIVDEARKMGCREWHVSGGEPMLRPDFSDIFDYITSKSASYSINTNGTLITPKIAKLLKRKGSKMVALCGATAGVHDHITRTPGSFEATMQGFAYLKEAGAGFTVQLIPMKDNYHEYKEMVELAGSVGSLYRIGAPWLYLSADGNPERNRQIMRQRLDPKDVVELDKPNVSAEGQLKKSEGPNNLQLESDDRLFNSCIAGRQAFHIDPYGQMSFCSFIKDSALRYDLKRGNFGDCWNKFIPNLGDNFRGGREYLENCGSCELRTDCRWCAVYGYLEHRNCSSKVEYLCAVANENRKFKENWRKKQRRYYQIAGVTIQLDSDLPITHSTFHPKFKLFEVDGPGEDTIRIRHHFSLPELDGQDLGKQLHWKPPWAINKKGHSWIYRIIVPSGLNHELQRLAVFNHDYTKGNIYSRNGEMFRKGNLPSLTLFPTDQILLVQLLADRDGCCIHSSGVIFEGSGLLFVGHSEAGKSTMVKALMGRAEILCDDRIIVRRHSKGFRIHGTWGHGEVPEVSANSGPLKGIFFLRKAHENRIVPTGDPRVVIGELSACLIKSFVTADWWDKMLSLVEMMVREIPCYSLYFNKSGKIADLIEEALGKEL